MPFKSNLRILSALFFISAWSLASAQTMVYKCESGGTVTYSEKNCRGHIVNTNSAPVPAKPNRKLQESQVLAHAMTPRAGESAGQFETRRHRATLMPTDRDECSRLDKRIPVEEASLTSPDPEEAAGAQEALGKSRQRFGALHCSDDRRRAGGAGHNAPMTDAVPVSTLPHTTSRSTASAWAG